MKAFTAFCCSPQTKMEWVPSRSAIVGITSFCYLASYPWGAWAPWLLQTFLSFMSDYVLIGSSSYFHVFDRIFALTQSFVFVAFALSTGLRWYEAGGCAIAFAGYAIGKLGIARQNFHLFRLGHTTWHLGSLTLVSVMSRNCDFVFHHNCKPRRVMMIWCDCASSYRPMVELGLFFCSICYAGYCLCRIEGKKVML